MSREKEIWRRGHSGQGAVMRRGLVGRCLQEGPVLERLEKAIRHSIKTSLKVTSSTGEGTIKLVYIL